MTPSDGTPTITGEAPTPAAPESATMTPGQGAGGTSDSATDEAAATTMSKKRKAGIAALVIALLILALLFAWYLMNRKPLSELPGLSQTKLPHYEFSIYGAIKPLGVAVTPSGDRIYVTESDGPRLVHVYDAKGKFLRTFAPKGNLGGKFNPLGLAFAPDGTLYATDVRGLDSKAHRVVVFSPDGTVVKSMGKPGQLSYPNGIVVDSHGNIEVADSNNGRLVVFNVAGKMISTISPGIGEGDLGLPRGTAVDDNGRLFVVDTADHMIRVYTIDKSKATPTYVGSFGNEGQTEGTFEYPNGVATDTRAHIYITDRENNRVQVWGY